MANLEASPPRSFLIFVPRTKTENSGARLMVVGFHGASRAEQTSFSIEEAVDTFLPRDICRVAAAFICSDQACARSGNRAWMGGSSSSGAPFAQPSLAAIRRGCDFSLFPTDFCDRAARQLASLRGELRALLQNSADDFAARLRILDLPVLFGTHHFPWFVGLALTVLWVLGITNAFNLIDGLDGLAAGSALFSTIVV